jgi:hypothetical protein
MDRESYTSTVTFDGVKLVLEGETVTGSHLSINMLLA